MKFLDGIFRLIGVRPSRGPKVGPGVDRGGCGCTGRKAGKSRRKRRWRWLTFRRQGREDYRQNREYGYL